MHMRQTANQPSQRPSASLRPQFSFVRRHRTSFMRFLPSLLAGIALHALVTPASAQEPEILVLSASEDADGTTQADFDLSVLQMLERRSVGMLEVKMRDFLRAQGQQVQLPKLSAESHYIESGGRKLAVVRIRSPRVANQVYIYGIKGKVFHRVACARTRNFAQEIPLFYGPCSEKLRDVFGVSINPR